MLISTNERLRDLEKEKNFWYRHIEELEDIVRSAKVEVEFINEEIRRIERNQNG